ncbi:hypothetical protein HYH03_017291 [Edaphochlamys debaryana]|uniref:Uncharacterized protein n=1 Tax=Edaphochlamys debaryana TaxID=47281 RepID=A0A836BPG1_9CHLO|nr:hypothetical protein HYH03_017291 [Edaphochlamys debaryana]|eukprot:KAG2483897.1 hypothetical protein HYH03_017291 [Edaphochlamys debaryana]
MLQALRTSTAFKVTVVGVIMTILGTLGVVATDTLYSLLPESENDMSIPVDVVLNQVVIATPFIALACAVLYANHGIVTRAWDTVAQAVSMIAVILGVLSAAAAIERMWSGRIPHAAWTSRDTLNVVINTVNAAALIAVACAILYANYGIVTRQWDKLAMAVGIIAVTTGILSTATAISTGVEFALHRAEQRRAQQQMSLSSEFDPNKPE